MNGRAMLPYGEVIVAVLVTRRAAPPLLPFVAPAATGVAAGAFVLHLPVTTRAARDGGRLVFGYPKFTADMEFEDAVETCRVRVDEGGHNILTQTIRPGGRTSVTSSPMMLYSVLDGELIEAKMPTFGLQQRVRPAVIVDRMPTPSAPCRSPFGPMDDPRERGLASADRVYESGRVHPRSKDRIERDHAVMTGTG